MFMAFSALWTPIFSQLTTWLLAVTVTLCTLCSGGNGCFKPHWESDSNLVLPRCHPIKENLMEKERYVDNIGKRNEEEAKPETACLPQYHEQTLQCAPSAVAPQERSRTHRPLLWDQNGLPRALFIDDNPQGWSHREPQTRSFSQAGWLTSPGWGSLE